MCENELFIRLVTLDLEDLARDLESSSDRGQEAGLDAREREVNRDRAAGAPADPDRSLFPDRDPVHA